MPYLELIINICDIILLFEETPGQQLEYHENMESFPLNYSIISCAIYGAITPKITAIFLTHIINPRHLRNFWGQIGVSTISSHSVEIPFPCTGATLPYTILYLPHSAPIQVASVLQGPGEHSSSFLTYLLLYCMLQPQAAWRSPL